MIDKITSGLASCLDGRTVESCRSLPTIGGLSSGFSLVSCWLSLPGEKS